MHSNSMYIMKWGRVGESKRTYAHILGNGIWPQACAGEPDGQLAHNEAVRLG